MLRAPSIVARMKTELETALALDSTQADAHYTLLLYYAQMPEAFGGSIAKARAHAASLRAVNPTRSQIGLAYIAEQEKRIADAERAYVAATIASPDSDAVFAAAGAFYRRQERWADAVAMHERQVRALRADALPSRVASAHYALGLALDKAGQRDAAQTSYRRALAADPDHVDAAKAVAGNRR
jgi:Tfp pilus assembly protein PilF